MKEALALSNRFFSLTRALLILTFLITFSSAGLAQIFSVSFNDKNATHVLKFLQKTYSLKLSYDPVKLKQYRITGNFEGESIDELIEKTLSDVPYELKKTGKVYLVVPSSPSKIVKGSVIDANTGQPLPSALIKSGPQKGTTSTQSGTFRLEDPRDSVELTISYLGYKTVTVKSIEQNFEIKLEPDTAILQPFILHAADQSLYDLAPSHIQVNTSQVASLPSLGEPDIFKSLQLLPGISATDETSSGLNVRGSTAEQNLVLMDGFTIYHLDHFFGIYSTFNPYMVDRIDVYKGGFNSEYGGRISSVIDTRGRVGNYNDFHGGASLTTTSLNTYLEGPIGKNVSAIGSFRASHQGLISNGVYNRFIKKNRVNIVDASDPYYSNDSPSLEPNLQFFDFNSKVRFRPNEQDYIDFNLYLSEDAYTGDFLEENEFESYSISDEADWGNIGASLNYFLNQKNDVTHKFSLSGSAYSSNSLLLSRYEYLIQEGEFEELEEELEDFEEVFFESDSSLIYEFGFTKNNEVLDMSLKWDRTQVLVNGHTLSLGVEINNLFSSYGFIDQGEPEELFEQNAWVSSGYGKYSFIVDRFKPTIGLRINHYSPSENWQIEPRLSAAYQITPYLSAKGAWTVHHQYFNRLSLSPFGNNDQFFWILADDVEDSYPVLRSEHFIMGGIFQKNGWTIDLEGYYKFSTGILESDFVLFNPSAQETDFNDEFALHGENISTGVDLLVKKSTDVYTTWISYNLGWSENSFPTINNGAWYPSLYDQRHEINWTNMYKMGKWDFSSTFIFGSGRPFTPGGGSEENLYDISRINSGRLTTYHRLDLAATRHFQFKNSSLDIGVTLFNIYNRQNIRSKRFVPVYNFDDEEDFEELDVTPLNISLLGFAPNIFISYKF